MIIGLVGLKSSGKDTLARLLKEEIEVTPDIPLSISILKFASGIKKILEDYFFISDKIYEDPILKEKEIGNTGKTVRDLMIFIGKEFRNFYPRIWVKTLNSEYTKLYCEHLKTNAEKENIYFITDVRFSNEIEYIIENNGILIDIYRNNLYSKEKRIIEIFGHNLFSKFIIYFLNKGLTYDSEWFYFKNRKSCLFSVDNTNLDEGLNRLREIILRGFFDAEKNR